MNKIIKIMGLITLLGCQKSPTFNYVTQTGLGIKVNDNGYFTNLDSIDIKVLETEKCLQNNDFNSLRSDYDKMNINILLDKVEDEKESFKCVESESGYCAGRTDGYTIDVTPDLKALKHEVIHWHGYRGNWQEAIKICET